MSIPATDFAFIMPEGFSLDFDVSPDPSFPTNRYAPKNAPQLPKLACPLTRAAPVITETTSLAKTDYEFVAASPDMLDFDSSD